MTDFTQTAVSMSAKREFTAPITDLAAFESVISSLMADETIGLTKREQGSISYTAKITYFNDSSDEIARISFSADNRETYDAGREFLLGDLAAEAFGGEGGEASEDNAKALWNSRVSCAIGDDTFTISFNRDSITVSGYAKTETLAAIEAWADTVDALA